jgi:uncharacterized membrane protein
MRLKTKIRLKECINTIAIVLIIVITALVIHLVVTVAQQETPINIRLPAPNPEFYSDGYHDEAYVGELE